MLQLLMAAQHVAVVAGLAPYFLPRLVRMWFANLAKSSCELAVWMKGCCRQGGGEDGQAGSGREWWSSNGAAEMSSPPSAMRAGCKPSSTAKCSRSSSSSRS